MDMKIEEGTESPQTVDEARVAVERSRQRISSTLDALEERIVEKKHEIQDRVDVMRPAREQISERPFTALAIGFGVGAFLGAVTGGSDDDDDVQRRRSGRVSGRLLEDDDREELKEWRRTRRKRLRAAMRRREHKHDDLHSHRRDRNDDDDDDSRFDALKHQLMGAITSAITTAVTTRVRRMATQNVGSLVESVLGGGGPSTSSDGDRPRGAGGSSRSTRQAERQSYP